MKITRTPDKAVILDGTGEFTLTYHPHQFQLDGTMYENAEPHLTIQNFHSHYVCPKHWQCRLAATWEAIKFIWRKK